MSKETGQPTGPTSNPVKKAIIVALATMVIMTFVLYLPYNRFTVIFTSGFAIFVIAYLYFLSREFGLWCQRVAGAAIGAVVAINIVPGISVFAQWGDASLWAKIEGRHWSIDLGLLVTAIAFGVLAYLYRRSTFKKVVSSNPTTKVKNVSGNPTGPNSPGVVIGDVTYDQSGSKVDQTVIDRLLKNLDEKDERVSTLEFEKDELLQKFKEGLERAKREAEKGEQPAKDALDEVRKSGDTEKLQRVLEKEADQHKDDFIERCLEISAIAFLRGDIETARKRVEDALKLNPDELRALNQLGHIEMLQGNLDTAESAYWRILITGEQSNDEHLISVGCCNLGLIMKTRGDLVNAEKMHRKALEINEKLNNLKGMGSDFCNLGNVLSTRGDLDGAEEMYHKALKIYEKLRRLEGIATVYGNLGLVFNIRGDLNGAEKMYRKSLQIEEKLGRLEGMARNFSNLGLVLQARSDLDGAEKMYRKALEINEKLGQFEGIAICYSNLGVVLQTRGDLDGAEKMYHKALQIDKKLGNLEGMASDYGNLGNVLKIRGKLNGAEKMYRKSLEINDKLSRLEGMAINYCNLGGVLQLRGDLDGAEDMYHKALEINEKLGRLEGTANIYSNLGIVLETRSDKKKAKKYWAKARDLYKQIGMPHMVEKLQGWIDGLKNPDAP